MTTEQSIPLNRLVLGPANVRRTGRRDGIAELAASIEAHGLRQNLNVRLSDDGEKYEVVAGGRRLRAMKQLVKAGRLTEDTPVNCLVLNADEDASEISLVENTLRLNMHPDDQFEAFRTLIDKGSSVDDVAARFGITPFVVKQRLKLANVSPSLRALFRKGEIGLDHVMAFTISDDHAAQEAAWAKLPAWNRSPHGIKDALTQDTIPVSDRLAKLIGTEAYIEAGGSIIRDLFDAGDEGYLSDRSLAMRLVEARLEQEAEAVRAEGWKWVTVELTRDYSVQYDRLPRGRKSAKARAGAGAVIRVDREGGIEVDRGLILPADAKAAKKAAARETKGEEGKPSGMSAALVADLTAHRTAALRMELSRNPHVALAVTVHALACSQFYQGESESCLELRSTSEPLERHVKELADCTAHTAMQDAMTLWMDQLPKGPGDLMAWCLDQPDNLLLDLLAFLSAQTVNAVQGRGRAGMHDHSDSLAKALSLDMAQWWTPSVEGFYGRLPKGALMRAVDEAKVGAVNFDKSKKAEAAQIAAKALTGSGWLPEPLRVPA